MLTILNRIGYPTLIVHLIPLNLYSLYLFFPNDFIRLLLTFSIIFYTVYFIPRVKFTKSGAKKIKKHLWITKFYFKVTKRSLLLSLFTLFLATFFATQFFLSLNGFYTQNVLNNYPDSNSSPIFSISTNKPKMTNNSLSLEGFSVLGTEIVSKVGGHLNTTEFKVSQTLVEILYEIRFNLSKMVTSSPHTYQNPVLKIFAMDKFIFDELTKDPNYNGSKTYGSNSSVALLSSFDEFNSSSEHFPLIKFETKNGLKSFNSSEFNFQFNGKILYSTAYKFFNLNFLGEYALFLAPELFIKLHHLMFSDDLAKADISPNIPFVSYTIVFLTQNHLFREEPLFKLITDTRRLNSELSVLVTAINSRDGPLLVENLIYPRLLKLQDSFNRLEVILLLFTVPLFGLSLFLLYFSTVLTEHRIRQVLNILKLRGTESYFVQTSYYLETILLSTLVILFSLLVSLPLVSIMFANFGLGGAKYLRAETFYQLLILTFTIFLNLSLFRDPELVNFGEYQTNFELSDRVPLWKSMNLDIILVVFGSLPLVFSTLEITSSNQVLGTYLQYFFPIGILLFVLGSILLIINYYSLLPIIFEKIFGNLNKVEVEVVSKNLKYHRHYTSKFIALVFLSTVLLTSYSLIPSSLSATQTRTVYYNSGSDLSLRLVAPLTQNETKELMNIPGIVASTPIRLGYYRSDKFYSMMGIDPLSYNSSAYWRPWFSSTGLPEIQQTLNTKGNTYVYTGSTDAGSIKVGRNFTMDFFNSYKVLNPIGTFHYLPKLITSETSLSALNVFFLTSIETFNSVFNVSQVPKSEILLFFSLSYYQFIKIKQGTDTNQLRSILVSKFPGILKFDDSISELHKTKNGLDGRAYSLTFLTDIGFVLALTLASTVFYSFLILDQRKREFGILRSLGMKLKTIWNLMFTESLLTLLLPLVLGIPVGLILTYYILLGYQIGITTIPPIAFVFDFGLLFIESMLLFSLSIVMASVPFFRIKNESIEKILRVT